jgi:transcriptional regulator with XRE-family HTH domain
MLMGTKVFRGDRLRQAREQTGLTQLELAKQLGMSQNQIYRYEVGLAEPLPDQIKRLAVSLHVTTDWLLDAIEDTNVAEPERPLTDKERRFLQALRDGNFRRLLNMIQEVIPEDNEDTTVSDEVSSDRNSLNGGK